MEVFHARGDFDNPDPFTTEDVVQKFKQNVGGIVADERADALVGLILEGGADDPFFIDFK